MSSVQRGPFQNAYVGYWIDRDHAGQGCTPEAFVVAARYAFEDARTPPPPGGDHPPQRGEPAGGREAGPARGGHRPALPRDQRRLGGPRPLRPHRPRSGTPAATSCSPRGSVESPLACGVRWPRHSWSGSWARRCSPVDLRRRRPCARRQRIASVDHDDDPAAVDRRHRGAGAPRHVPGRGPDPRLRGRRPGRLAGDRPHRRRPRTAGRRHARPTVVPRGRPPGRGDRRRVLRRRHRRPGPGVRAEGRRPGSVPTPARRRAWPWPVRWRRAARSPTGWWWRTIETDDRVRVDYRIALPSAEDGTPIDTFGSQIFVADGDRLWSFIVTSEDTDTQTALLADLRRQHHLRIGAAGAWSRGQPCWRSSSGAQRDAP